MEKAPAQVPGDGRFAFRLCLYLEARLRARNSATLEKGILFVCVKRDAFFHVDNKTLKTGLEINRSDLCNILPAVPVVAV